MSLENIADRLIGDFVTEIGQGALDPVVSPVGILFRHAEYQLFDGVRNCPPSWFLFPLITGILFLRHQLLIPTEDSVRSDERGHVRQSLATPGLFRLHDREWRRTIGVSCPDAQNNNQCQPSRTL